MSQLNPFHLAVTVHDLEQARHFYGVLMGFEEGRSSDAWIDFNMFGHQFVVHLDSDKQSRTKVNHVDGHGVPVPHFGVVLTMSQWRGLVAKLESSNIDFLIEPYIRFEGDVGEQGTVFFLDPSGNALEFKGFRDIETELFAK